MGNISVHEKLRKSVYECDLKSIELSLSEGGDPEWTPHESKGNYVEGAQWRAKREIGASMKLMTMPDNSPLYADEMTEGAMTCLHLAVALDLPPTKKYALCKTLIEEGCAMVNAACRTPHMLTKQTPLHYAAQLNMVPIVQLLLNCGANPNHMDSHGYTPLLVAGRADNLEVLCLLLDRGADPDVKDCHGFTVLRHLKATVGGSSRGSERKAIVSYLEDNEKQKKRAEELKEIVKKQREFATLQAAEYQEAQQRQAAQRAAAAQWQVPVWPSGGLYEEVWGPLAPL